MIFKLKKKIYRLYNTINFSIKSYDYLSTLFNLERKVINSIELNDEEYFQLKDLTGKVPKKNKFYVDVGSGDGVNGSCTLGLAKNDGWKGLAIDRSRPIFSNYIYRNIKDVVFTQNTVTPNNIESILKSYSIGKNFGFLNLDIDSYDFEVLETILLSGYRPKIISAEINEVFPPPIEFYVKFNGVKNSELMVDHFFGCSLSSVNKLLAKYEYNLINVFRNNAFFVLKNFLNIESKDELNAYKEGYLEQHDRDEVFPYNVSLNHILKKTTNEQIIFFKERFKHKESNFFIS